MVIRHFVFLFSAISSQGLHVVCVQHLAHESAAIRAQAAIMLCVLIKENENVQEQVLYICSMYCNVLSILLLVSVFIRPRYYYYIIYYYFFYYYYLNNFYIFNRS